MKALDFIYKESTIHFLVNPNDGNVMVNATEMAKLFSKRVDHFTKSDHAKAFIKVFQNHIEQTPNGGRSDRKIIDNRGHMGIYFDRRLALKFAAWLDVEFEFWVYSTIDEIVFGNYKKHWEAHARQEEAKEAMETLRDILYREPTKESVAAYFELERQLKLAKNDKTKAIRNQLKMF
ncbi:KilA-N domain-containing protein [Arenibacter sp. 6A1]|uniref:KilA-N domain-containing protein n=1 Tax=Arenibacter sp. 6A1 TaxID=2720391 RepID=UPI001445450B|nr:KilA-N domain-containing protein [Arenibacter sp. 6A1]NKI28235.1 KilA-N domain-containing protein [Arenibacter sp. 6A1]